MKTKKRILSIVLCLCMVCSLLPVTALAADSVTLDIGKGNITITATGYTAEGASTETAYTGDYIITGTTTENTITVNSGANITLQNVNIALTAAGTPHAIKSESDLNLTLAGKNTLTAAGTYDSNGVDKGVIYSGTNITIGGSGELNVTANADTAGYGIYSKNGSVAISGDDSDPTVTATAEGTYSYGIYSESGSVTIKNGTISATASATNSCGIRSNGNVTISGGSTVAATGHTTGIYSYNGDVTINGTGTVVNATTTAKDNGYGISANQGIIAIDGGTVTAEGGYTGIYGNNGVTIEDGTVNATGGQYGAGISGSEGTVKISGGIVTATSGKYGISGGTNNVAISGGTVTATGATNGIYGTFSTGTDGSAFIVTNSFSNMGSPESGVIFVGNTGTVYGNPTITGTATIPANATLTIPDGAKLTIGEGGVLVNNGTISGTGTLDKTNGGIIYNSGTLPEGVTSDITLYGDFLVTDGEGNPLTAGADFSYDNGTLAILTATELTLSTPLCTAANPGSTTISVAKNITNGAKLTLDGVHISIAAAPAIKAESDLNLTLAEGSTNTLTATGSTECGIWGLGGDITIDGAGTVTAEGYLQGIYGVTVTIGSATGKPNVTATGKADGICGRDGVTISSGTVTATGGTNGIYGSGGVTIEGGTVEATGGRYGIYGTFSTGDSGNAVIFTNSFSNMGSPASGVIFVGNAGTVYGNPAIGTNATIPAGATLTIPADATLTIGNDVTLTNNGTIIVKGTLTKNGTVRGGVIYEITAQPTDQTANEGSTATFTVTASGSPTYQWQQRTDSGANWTDVGGATDASYTTNAATTAMNGYQYRCIVTYGGDSINSAAATLTVNASIAPVYTIEADTQALDFGSVRTGYTQPATKAVTIKNMGNQSITLTQLDPTAYTNFVVSQLTGLTLANNGDSATFTVQPKPGLAAGTYSETITVSNTNGESATITVSFTVRTQSSGGYTPPAPKPQPETGNSGGWDEIQDELKDITDKIDTGDIQPGETVTVDMNGATEVPGEVLEEIAGKDVNVEFDMGNGTTWTVNGQDIPAGIGDLNLGVETGGNSIPVNVINAITGEMTTMQLELSHDGPFGAVLHLSLEVGEENSGYWANLYYYNEVLKELVFKHACRIDADGKASWPFDHASSYAIVIDDENHDPNWVNPFTDVAEDDWFYSAVEYVNKHGLMEGTADTLFSPNLTTSRGMIVTILWRLEGEPNVVISETLLDVPESQYYYQAVKWAISKGILEGYGEGYFGPDDPITREELATILWRYAQYKGIDVSVGEDTNILSYNDAFDISDWAMDAMQWACGEGIIQGYNGNLTPQGDAKRSEAAAMLMRFLSDEE